MANDKVYIFDEENIRINVYEESRTDVHLVNENPSIEIVRIYEPGPQGPKGLDGTAQIPNLVVTSSQQIDFYLIGNAPFYPIVSGSLFGTTSSFGFFGLFSSSLLPWSSSFDLGSITNAWKNVYVTNSIIFVNGDVEIQPFEIINGYSDITTSSFGFDDYFIKRISPDQQIMKIQSGSLSASFNIDGVFVVPDFSELPPSVPGGIIKSGSEIFFGI